MSSATMISGRPAPPDGPVNHMYWPLVVASMCVGFVGIPAGFAPFHAHGSFTRIAVGEAVITGIWIAVVLAITLTKPSSVPPNARVAGVFVTAFAFSAMLWFPVLYGHDYGALILLAIAAPFVSPFVGAAVAGSTYWVAADGRGDVYEPDPLTPVHRLVVPGTYAASFVAAAVAIPIAAFVTLIMAAQGNVCTENGPCGDTTSLAGFAAGEAVLTVVWIGAAIVAFGARQRYAAITDRDRATAVVFTAIVFSLLFWGTVILALHGHRPLLLATPIAFAVAPYVGAIVAREQM